MRVTGKPAGVPAAPVEAPAAVEPVALPKPPSVNVSPELDALIMELAGKFDISRPAVVRRAVELLNIYVEAREQREKIGVVKRGEPCFEAVTELRPFW